MPLIPKANRVDVPDPPKITSVELLKQVVDNINAQISLLDQEVALASQGDNAHVHALYDCIHEIKSRSDQAEMILLEITSEPQKLSACEEQMTRSAATNAALDTLVAKIDELEKELKEAEFDYYTVVADLFVDVLAQMEPFERYVAIPQVRQVKAKIEAIAFELRRQVQWSFREIGPLTSGERYEYETVGEKANDWDVDVSELSTVYMVVDALGDKFRDDLLERFAQLQLIPYEKLFQWGAQYSGLEHLEQRYAWFRYLLQIVDEKLQHVLPAKWNAPFFLFVEFVRRTKKHLADALAQYEKETPDLEAQVPMLLKAVKNVHAFETEMLAYFARMSGDDKERRMEESIKDAFDPFLGGYVQLERQGLEELMDSLFRGEDVSQNGPPPSPGGSASSSSSANNATPSVPYESSRKIFEYIKGSLKRCTSFSTGITFLSLSREFRVCLENYAMYLKNRCPSPVSQRDVRPVSKIPQYPFNKLIETTLCRVICTGEYCIDTIPALETMMKAKIQPQYEEMVDFQPQIEKFMDTISFTMGVLAAGEVRRMDVDFNAMKNINWAAIEDVGDVGAYTKHMLKICSDCVPRIRPCMSAVYFQQCCSRIASTFLDAFQETIWQLRRINKNGGGQLLLDLNGIKEYLLVMPNARLSEGQSALVISKPYTIAVTNKAKKVENMLKLICAEEASVEEMFSVLWPDISKEDKDAILVLKGQKNALDQVHDKVKDSIHQVGHKTVGGIKKVSQGAVGDISTGFSKMGVGFKSAFGDIMSGNLFMDGSGHDDRHSSHGASSNKAKAGVGSTATASNKGKYPPLSPDKSKR